MPTIKIGKLLAHLSLLTGIFLSGCSSTGFLMGPAFYFHQSELQSFTPAAEQDRIQTAPRVRWVIREDVSEYCAAVTGIPIRTTIKGEERPVACALWNKKQSECTIHTGPETSHTILGHELRHCFEGSFHN